METKKDSSEVFLDVILAVTEDKARAMRRNLRKKCFDLQTIQIFGKRHFLI
jgi:hypothetical protein